MSEHGSIDSCPNYPWEHDRLPRARDISRQEETEEYSRFERLEAERTDQVSSGRSHATPASCDRTTPVRVFLPDVSRGSLSPRSSHSAQYPRSPEYTALQAFDSSPLPSYSADSPQPSAGSATE